MSTQVQYRRGSATENNAFTGALAEITVDTTNWTLRVHDGATAGGGGNLATVDYVDAQISAISSDAISNGTSNVKVLTSGGNIAVTVGSTGIVSFTASGILNSQANGVGNIGDSSTYFNTVFAKATSAQYADLAEMYRTDLDYAPGTVVCFGGPAEVTISSIDHDVRVAGVISTDPAFVMNTGLDSSNTAAVALTGRVPCRVKGTIHKGDRLVSSDTPGVAQALDLSKYQPGCIIGKALESHVSSGEGLIEVVVGRV